MGSGWAPSGWCGKDGCFLGSRQGLLRFLGSLDHPSSNHGEGDEEGGGGPRPHEGDAARDEGHEVSWDLIPVVRSGSLRVLCAGSSVWVLPHLLSVGRKMHLSVSRRAGTLLS